MSFSIKPLGYGQVAVLYNGKHVKKFGGANAAEQAKDYVEKQAAQSLPKERAQGMGTRQVAEEMFSINSNIGSFSEDMLEQFTEDEINDMIEKYTGFNKLSGELKNVGARNPEALAAWIGRKKYGKKKFQKAAGSDKKMRSMDEAVNMDKWMAKYDENEDNNAHTLNALNLAKLAGDESDVTAMKGIKKRHEQNNGIGGADYDARNEIHKRLWPKAVQMHNDWKAKSGVTESLTKQADAGKWISDFEKSDAPQFKGKSKEKRKQMALAAYYAKKNESVEDLEEGLRLVSRHGDGRHTAKVYKDTDWGEYRAKFFTDGKHLGDEKDYHSDDLDDAKGSAEDTLRRMNSVKEDTTLGNEGEFKKADTTFKKAKKQPKQGVPEQSLEVKESFLKDLTNRETISETIEIKLDEKTSSYETYFRAMMSKKGINSIDDLKSDKKKAKFMNNVDKHWKAKNEAFVCENFMRSDVEDRINDHRKLGNKVSEVKYETRSGKPYAEFVIQTPEGTKKRYTFHGNVTRHEVVSDQ